MWYHKRAKKKEQYLQERAEFFSSLRLLDRRNFLKVAGMAAAAAAAKTLIPPHTFQWIDVAQAATEAKPSFSFAYISDTHLYERTLNERFVKAAMRAVQDVNSLNPQPDFVFFAEIWPSWANRRNSNWARKSC